MRKKGKKGRGREDTRAGRKWGGGEEGGESRDEEENKGEGGKKHGIGK